MTVPSDIEQQTKEVKVTNGSEHTFQTVSTSKSSKSKSSIVMLPVDQSVVDMVMASRLGNETEEDPDFTCKTGTSSKLSKSSRVVLPVETSVLEMVMTSGLDNELEEEPDRRKTALYCGVCCDVRQACIVQLILYLIWMLLSINYNYGLYGEAIKIMEFVYDDDDDDYTVTNEENEAYAIEQANRMIILMIKNASAVPFISIGLYGAFTFKKYLVLCCGIWCCVDIIWSCIMLRFIMFVLVFTVYPLFALFEAIHKGKMTPDNYKRTEKHCCCSCCLKK